MRRLCLAAQLREMRGAAPNPALLHPLAGVMGLPALMVTVVWKQESVRTYGGDNMNVEWILEEMHDWEDVFEVFQVGRAAHRRSFTPGQCHPGVSSHSPHTTSSEGPVRHCQLIPFIPPAESQTPDDTKYYNTHSLSHSTQVWRTGSLPRAPEEQAAHLPRPSPPSSRDLFTSLRPPAGHGHGGRIASRAGPRSAARPRAEPSRAAPRSPPPPFQSRRQGSVTSRACARRRGAGGGENGGRPLASAPQRLAGGWRRARSSPQRLAGWGGGGKKTSQNRSCCVNACPPRAVFHDTNCVLPSTRMCLWWHRCCVLAV